jgi:hypothetical protein
MRNTHKHVGEVGARSTENEMFFFQMDSMYRTTSFLFLYSHNCLRKQGFGVYVNFLENSAALEPTDLAKS